MTGEVIDFKCRPTLKSLLNQLAKLHKRFPGSVFRLCYEASYIGFSLLRDLTKKGYHCEVVVPNSIPRPQGKQIKTDRLDACDLARFYATGLLTVVAVPEREQEQDRDLLRSRRTKRRVRKNGVHDGILSIRSCKKMLSGYSSEDVFAGECEEDSRRGYLAYLLASQCEFLDSGFW